MTDIIAFKGEVEFASASEDDKTGRVVRLRRVKTPDQVGLAHPFATGRRRKAKRPGTRFLSSFVRVDTGAICYSGEVMLLGWSDGPGGSLVTFLLEPDMTVHHPFYGCVRVSGAQAGTRFMAAMSEIGDDERAVQQRDEIPAAPEAEPPAEPVEEERHGQRKSNVAAMMVKNPRLHDWLRETVRDMEWDSKQADEWLKGVCRISSKKELDVPGDAVERFERIIRQPFVYWQEDQGMFRGDR